MKRILFLVVVLFCCFPAISFAAKFNGRDYEVKYKNFTWDRMGGDVNVLTTLDDNVVFLQHIGLISQACADTLKANWNRGNISKTLVISGNRFDAEVYGGVSSSKLKVVIGTITIGTGFDSQFGGQPASAWLITAEDLVFNRLVDMYWFQTGLNGKTQCNNVCLKFRPRVERVVEIPTEPVRIEVQVPVYYPVPEYYETIIRDTVEVEAKPFCKINGWVSHSQDHFSDKPNDHFIWSLMGNVRVKCGFESSAITTSFDWGYQDGPIDWNWRIGGVKSWNHRTWFEMGCEFRYYEFTHYWWLKRLQSDSFGRLELGPYIQWDQFLDRTGKDHVEMYIAQDVRPLNSKLGTSEIKGSIKLEPNPWYLFLSGSYRFTPGERIDSLTAPKFKHSSWEPRVGIQIGRNTIFFLRHRGINHYQFQDGVNEWSDYKRRDLSLGVFYRPQTFLGIPNLYWEFICGYSKITEKNQNPINNNEDELLELKLTGFWNWKF